MAKFKNIRSANTPEVSTASLPDIVFMLLFFFMTVTVMKDDSLKVVNELSNASEIKKLEKKDRVITIYVGRPAERYRETFGSEPKIQLNDKLVDISTVGAYVLEEIGNIPEGIRKFATVSLKVDKKASMGLISDIKQELRKRNALKINYTTYEGDSFKNVDSML